MIGIIQTTTHIGITDNVLKINNDSNEDMAYSFGNILENDDYYTFSCWMKSDNNTHTDIYISDNFKEFALTPEWTRVVFTSKFSSSSNKTVKFSVIAGAQIYAYEGQLEHGNKATDFRSNEKDITDSIQTVDEKLVVLQTDFSVEQGRIESLIKETTIDNDDGTKSSLKDKYLETVKTVDGMKTTIGDVQTNQTSMSSKITEIETSTESIKTSVTKAQTTADSAKTTAEQTASKFSWIVNSGTSATDFTLTDRTAQLVANNINLHGLVTFEGLDSSTQNAINNKANQSIIDNWAKDSVVNGETVINGGYIKTNTIKTDQLAVDDIFATGSSVMNIINAQEINANRITSGLLSAERINVYGLSILNKTTNQQTFNISNNGEVTIRGSVSSGNYVESKTGWTINNDGTAEFNDIIARGSVITNDGGIVSAGGSGRNLQLNTSFYNGLTSWIKGSNHSIDTGFQYKLTNTVKFERSGLTSDSIQWLYSGSNAIRCTVGKSYTAQANFYTKDSSAIDGSGVIFGIYFYTSDSSSAGTFRKKVSFTNNQWVHETITAVAPQNAVYVAIVIGVYRNGTFWMAHPKLEEGDVATDWSLAPEDKTKQVRFWAGTSFEERESAPWMVYSDGSMKATEGEFSGVFSGTVDIGNIKIADPSSTAGGDALLTIQNGQNGIKRVQLTDTSASRFAQDIIIADDHDADKISLKQDGTAVVGTGINVGNNVILNDKSLIMNNNELTTTDDGASYLFKSSVTLGTSVGPANLIVNGNANMNDVTVNEHLYFGNNVKITKVSNGVNIDVIK